MGTESLSFDRGQASVGRWCTAWEAVVFATIPLQCRGQEPQRAVAMTGG
jgi:hypothetical protein